MPDSTGSKMMKESSDYWVCSLPPAPEVRASVVIPSFGAEDTLVRAAESALGQTLHDIEVIIVDDASPDQSWPLIAGLMAKDRRVRSLRNRVNCGKSVSMNRAVSVAQGRWLAVLDADDWYHPERLETLISAAERRHVEMVADNQLLYDARAHEMVGSAWPEGNTTWKLDFDDFLLGSNAYENFNLGMLKPVIRTDFMRNVGLGYEVTARQGEDFFHLLQFFLNGGEALICDTPYYYYTQPFGTISRQWSHAERTRYDFQNALEINRRYLQDSRHVLSERQRRRLAQRHHGLRVLESYFSAKDAVAEKRWLEASLMLARQPGTLLHLARRLGSRLNVKGDSQTIPRIAARARRRERATEESDA
ncbi:MAG TPA: glycosyltransferase [Magnetospirillaceae bacterium]|nr:glycosyltransferase [Magnetospirillaceae bacterium]